MIANKLRHASLERTNKETGEVVLVMTHAEFRELYEAVEAGSKAEPRKTKRKALLAELDHVGAW